MAILYILICLTLAFCFLNGFHDSSNIVATIISSRAMSPNVVLALVALAEFAGPFLFGVAVAKTIGEGIINIHLVTVRIILAALGGSIAWNIVTWFLGIPSSSSHALIGGMAGAVLISIGPGAVYLDGLMKVVLTLFISPVVGLAGGFLIMKLILFLARNASLRINWFFKNIQILTGILLALSHGANDGQKSMGIIALGLVITGNLPTFEIPTWVIALSGIAIGLGTMSGGWRLIRTLGGRFYKIRPVHGFATQLTSASVILGAAFLGGPVSTTQVVSSAILGIGSAERINKVRWGVAGQIVVAWLLTIPATALTAALLYIVLGFVI